MDISSISKKDTNYLNPPVVEALIDIRTSLSDGFLEKEIQLNKAYLDFFERPDPINFFRTTIDNKEQTTNTTAEKIGLRYKSYDESYILQSRKDGLTFSFVKNKYPGWEIFYSEAQKYWNIYKTIINPKKILKIAVRYINNINIPVLNREGVILKDYFSIYPMFSDPLFMVEADTDKKLSSFFYQTNLNLSPDSQIIITQGLNTLQQKNAISILLDLDVFSHKVYDANVSDVWEDIKKLKMQENDFFERAITNETRKLFI